MGNKPRQMSPDHKAALAEGREHGRTVRRYLDALTADRPKRGRPATRRTPEELQGRIDELERQIAGEDDVIHRLSLVQERLEVQADLDAVGPAGSDLSELEAEFIKVAAAYSERKGLTRAAWRRIGVPPRVLTEAGIR